MTGIGIETQVPSSVYSELRAIWQELDPDFRCNPRNAIAAARKLQHRNAAQWIEDNPEAYSRGTAFDKWRLAGDFTGSLVLMRYEETLPGPNVLVNLPRLVSIRENVPFEFGSENAGCCELALNVLTYFLRPTDDDRVRCTFGNTSNRAIAWHEDYARDVLAKIPGRAGLVTAQQTETWIAHQRSPVPA